MTQIQRENAIHRIRGYFLPKPGESNEAAFARAKEETLTNMRRDVADVEAVTPEQFNYQGTR